MTTHALPAHVPHPHLHVPYEAEIVERVQESRDIFTLRLQLTDPAAHDALRFAPGQFNMLYLFGVGEVAISIVSDPADTGLFDHTIRAVGRVTRALSELAPGARIGIRGPYGRGWPLAQAAGRDVVILTGGLGCAPVVSVIRYVARRRAAFGHFTIIQGVKHSADLIWRDQYDQWRGLPDTTVLLAADQGGPSWPWHVGRVTDLLNQAPLRPERTSVMMCGPEIMMLTAARLFEQRGVAADAIHLSMERNMQCALAQCGHCQFGARYVCRDGPVFPYSELRGLLGVKGY